MAKNFQRALTPTSSLLRRRHLSVPWQDLSLGDSDAISKMSLEVPSRSDHGRGSGNSNNYRLVQIGGLRSLSLLSVRRGNLPDYLPPLSPGFFHGEEYGLPGSFDTNILTRCVDVIFAPLGRISSTAQARSCCSY